MSADTVLSPLELERLVLYRKRYEAETVLATSEPRACRLVFLAWLFAHGRIGGPSDG